MKLRHRVQHERHDREDRRIPSRRTSTTNAMDTLALPRPPALTEIVAERLVTAIQDGTLKPGERLVEMQLAARLGVSRAPLREALKALEASGIVESRRGRGTYVREVTAEEAEHVLAVRAVLEGLAARLYAVSATPAMIEELAGLNERIEEAAGAGESAEWRRLDWSFHEQICVFSGNPFLLNAWRSLSNLVRIFLLRHEGYLTDMPAVLANHRAVLKAIRDRDPDRAEKLFRGTILRSGYARLARPIPATLAVYVEEGPPRSRGRRSERRKRVKRASETKPLR
jgi:DNA-binding GntR family transcriptional regulator